MTFDQPAVAPHARKSTWESRAQRLLGYLRTNDLATGVSLIESVERDAWRAMTCSDYSVYAAAILVRTGRYSQALDVIRDAYRYGFQRFYYFDPAWGSHGLHLSPDGKCWLDRQGREISSDGGFELHALLEPVYHQPELVDFIRAHFNPKVVPWGFDIESTPLCWLAKVNLTRRCESCVISARPLAKGDEVYELRYFNGSFDIPTKPFVAAVDAFASSPRAAANRYSYETDAYELDAFRFKVGYHHPMVSSFWRASTAFDLEASLDFIARPEEAPTPYAYFAPDGTQTESSEEHVLAGTNAELLDLLWVLVKCGHLPRVVDRLASLPRHFALALMLFDRTTIRQAVAAHLAMPELVHVYEVVAKAKPTAADRAFLVRFGQQHPEFQMLLAESLRLYEYHLCSNYVCSPNWFFKDFHYFVQGNGRNFLWLLASRVDLLPVLAGMRARRELVGRRDATVVGIGYEHIFELCYAVILVHASLTGHPEVDYWTELPDSAADRFAADLKKGRRLALDTLRSL